MKIIPQGGAARSALHLIAAWRAPLALIAAALCLIAGVMLPIMRVSRLIVFSRPISIVDCVQILLADGDWTTATIIAVFSIVVPAVKIAALLLAWARLRRGASVSSRLLSAVDGLGRWAMLDVLVVALVIVLLKTGSFTDATTAPAIYPFIGAIFLTAYSGRAVIRRARA
jgi:paraquat-inducible protein A